MQEKKQNRRQGNSGDEAREAYVRANQELMASIIYCEAGNQPYEGQVAVGAVIMNRVKSGSYPDSIEAVIYQSGQFGPAATGWLNRVRSSKGYSQTALQAAVDALNGSNQSETVFILIRAVLDEDRSTLFPLIFAEIL